MADGNDSTRALEELGRRIERIERHLSLGPMPAAAPPRAESIARDSEAEAIEHATSSPTAQPAPLVPPISSSTRPAASWSEQFKAGHAAAQPASPPATSLFTPALPSRPWHSSLPGLRPVWSRAARTERDGAGESAAPAVPRRSWETLIGERWLAWAGSITVVIGAIFLAGYIDVGNVWGSLPSLIKCSILAAFGGGMLLAGEVVMRRYGLTAAVGLYAAGLGTLYITAYASFGWYALISETAALVLMGAVSAAGCGLTLRARSLAIGALSLIGAFLAPLLLRSAPVAPLAQPL